MLDTLFVSLYDAMAGPMWLVLLASVGWGVLSIVLSPCHLSSIPLVVGFISTQGKISASRTFIISLVFAVGILITIGLIGVVTASMGRLMGDVGPFGKFFVAAIFVVVGLHLLDIISLDWNAAVLRKTRLTGLPAAVMLGLLFGIALGPCTFAFMAPVLGVVFATVQANPFTAALVLVSFGIGHCSVIVAAGSLTGTVQRYLQWTERSPAILWTKRGCGTLVILGGVYSVFFT
jgi:cytochrome c-type biogenesis protein